MLAKKAPSSYLVKGRVIVVIGAFENEAKTLRHEVHLIRLAPAE